MTFKKPKYHIVKSINALDKITATRKQFLVDIKTTNYNKIISIDESGFNMITNKQKGLSVKGVKINVPIDQIKNKNITPPIG